jgi:hypothetical protein
MKPSTKVLPPNKPLQSWKKQAPDSHEQNDLADAVIDYYLANWKDIMRNFKMQNPQEAKEILPYALDLFIRYNSRAYNSRHKEFLKRVHAQIETHYLDLWQHFEDDPEYKEGLLEHRAWLASFRKSYPAPPTTYWDLRLCLACCEAYMLVADY